MKIDKWLLDGKTKEEREKIEEYFKSLPEDEIQELKKRKIREIKVKREADKEKLIEPGSFLSDIIAFKEWLNQRTYLKGDLNKIEMKISNLYRKLNEERDQIRRLNSKETRSELSKEFKRIPVRFLDEKTRIAINKKINGMKRTNSDNYYLRKLKKTIQEKRHEIHYYEILKKILES